jgi:hypothetical protein
MLIMVLELVKVETVALAVAVQMVLYLLVVMEYLDKVITEKVILMMEAEAAEALVKLEELMEIEKVVMVHLAP